MPRLHARVWPRGNVRCHDGGAIRLAFRQFGNVGLLTLKLAPKRRNTGSRLRADLASGYPDGRRATLRFEAWLEAWLEAWFEAWLEAWLKRVDPNRWLPWV